MKRLSTTDRRVVNVVPEMVSVLESRWTVVRSRTQNTEKRQEKLKLKILDIARHKITAQTFKLDDSLNKGKMGVPYWNGLLQVSLGV